MLKLFSTAIAGVLLLAPAVCAADYSCASKEIGAKLNDYDSKIAGREAAIAEMRAEIKEGGGATDQQTKAVAAFEEKVATAKAEREALLKECNAK
jgi:hypothetical protein